MLADRLVSVTRLALLHPHRIGIVVSIVFLSGCVYPQELVQDIYLSDPTPVAGKRITNLGFFYSEIHQAPVTVGAVPEVLGVVRFTVQNAEREDLEKVHEIIRSFFETKFKDQYRLKAESAGPVWMDRTMRRYLLKEDRTANPRNYADIEWHGDDGVVKVRLGCSVACDRELLERVLGRNAVAPLSPQASKNYEMLKARLFPQDVDLQRLAGTWQGEIETTDKAHKLTAIIAADGSFKLTVAATNSHWQGKISVREGRIFWWNYTTNASGLMTYSADGERRYIRGARHDGTEPFSWWSEKQ